MPNQTLQEAESAFVGNINYTAQPQTEVQNTIAEAAPLSPDSTLGEKGGK